MTHSPLLDATVVRTDHQLSSTLGGEEVVLNLQDGVYYGLNHTGARIWALLDHVETPRSLCDRLEREYDADRGTLESHVLALLGDLEREGLVELREPSGGAS